MKEYWALGALNLLFSVYIKWYHVSVNVVALNLVCYTLSCCLLLSHFWCFTDTYLFHSLCCTQSLVEVSWKSWGSKTPFCSSSALNHILDPENLNSVNRCAKWSFDVYFHHLGRGYVSNFRLSYSVMQLWLYSTVLQASLAIVCSFCKLCSVDSYRWECLAAQTLQLSSYKLMTWQKNVGTLVCMFVRLGMCRGVTEPEGFL